MTPEEKVLEALGPFKKKTAGQHPILNALADVYPIAESIVEELRDLREAHGPGKCLVYERARREDYDDD